MPKHLVPLLAAALAACAPPAAPPAAPTPAAPLATAALPKDVLWVRTAAEHDALFLQTFRSAADQLRALSRDAAPRTWAVIMDADETAIDNSPYQRRRAELDSAYTPESWAEWVREARAEALPGVVEFARLVHGLGGRVAIVTNRDDALCPDTRRNLVAAGIAPDVVLCRPAGASDKNPRFLAVQAGTAAPGLPPLRVLMWLGDNIGDFPALTQAARGAPGALEPFGRTFWVLPNPMYGSWERNAPR